MKEAIWGVLIVALGLLGIVIVQTFQNVTVTNDQNYYLLKETTEAAMLDAVDLTYYRSTGKVRIVEDKFVENFTRRFAESAIATQDYDIVIHSVIETPPFVSVSLGAYVFSLKGDTFNIRNSIDSIIETKYSREKYEESKGDSIEFTCLTGECDVTSCITGDLRFTGWGSVALPSSQCKEGFTVEDIDRNVNYQACENGKWVDKSDTTTSTHKSGTDLTYTWTYFKDSIFHDINVKTTETVAFGDCINSFTICPPGGLTIYVGENVRLTPEYNPSDAVNRELTWESNNSSVSVMGLIEAIASGKSVGNATITATSSNNKKATCKIDVIALSCPSQMLVMDPNTTEQATLINGIVPSNATWSIDNTNYATIDSNGKITSKDTYGVYYYRVLVNGEEIECPFEIKNTQAKELIVTCDKENMNIYEQTSCTVKSSVTGEVLTGATLACTINNKKVEPVSNSNNTIVCSPEEVGELIVTAIKETYTPGSDSVIVSEIGKETLAVNCVKGGTDTTPLSTGINFNTPITCSVSGYKTADLSFVYKSYTGNTVPGGTKEIKNGSSIDFITGSTKGTLILTATKGKQKIVKYFEVGCVPGDIIAYFNVKSETLPDLCPQHFDFRLEDDEPGAKYYQLYTSEVPPIIENNAKLCGVYGYSDPSNETEYSITGSSDDLTVLKNYRSYFDQIIPINIYPSLTIPNIDFPKVGEYSYNMLFTFDYDKIDIDGNGRDNDPIDALWDTNVHAYLNTAVESRSHTIIGTYLKATDTYCVEFAEEHPISDQTINPIVSLTPRNNQYYIVPEQIEAKQYFIDVSINYPQYFANTGTWTSSDEDILIVREYQYDWTYGRAEARGKSGKVTITFTADLNELGQQLFGKKTVSGSITLTAIKNCDDLYLEIENTDIPMIYKKPTSYYENVASVTNIISINEKSPGNAGKWTILSSNPYDELKPGVNFISSVQELSIDESFHINPIEIEYERTLDKCNKYINIKPFYDKELPTIEVKYKNNIVTDKIYLKVGDSFLMSDLVATATDDNPNFGVKILQPDEPVVINTNFTNTYKINYSVRDLSGKIAEKTITIVITKLEIKPPICVVSYSSPSGYSGGWTNKNVTVTGTCVSQGGVSCNDTISYTFDSNTNTATAGPGPNGGIGQVCDSDGNCATCEATTTVKIDTSSPTCVVSGGSTSWFNTDRTITGTCSDSGGSACVDYKVSKTFTDNFRDSTESPGTIRDGAGNITDCGSAYVKIDKIAPKCSSSGGSTSWTNSAIVLTGTCTDTGSGCVRNATKSFVQTTELYNQSPGTVYDKAGNSIPCPSNQTVKIDKVVPTCVTSSTYSDTGTKYVGIWTNRNITLTGTCSDTLSGCDNTKTATATYSSDINSSSESPGTIYDMAGNSTVCSGTTVKIDKTPPSCRTSSKYTSSGIRYNGSWVDESITLTGECSYDNTGGSGCNSSKTATKVINYNLLSTGESPGAVYDNAGNAQMCAANLIVKVDMSNPTVTIGNCTTQTLLSSSRYLSALVSNSGPSPISYEWFYEGDKISTNSTWNATKTGSYTVTICNKLNKCDSAACYLKFRKDFQ